MNILEAINTGKNIRRPTVPTYFSPKIIDHEESIYLKGKEPEGFNIYGPCFLLTSEDILATDWETE